MEEQEKIIVKKSNTPFFVYIGWAVASIVLTVLGLSLKNHVWIIGAVLTAAVTVLIVCYLLAPNKIVSVTNGDSLLVNGKTIVPLRKIKNVTFKKSSKNAQTFEWGRVYIELYNVTITLKYVENCQKAAEEILSLIRG